MGAATIRIFLVDGTPLGIRIIEKSNWTGRGIDFARADWARARVRDDFQRPGVYVLAGITDDGRARVYVGEADVLGTRISQHQSGPAAKDFWTRAVAFTSKDENLNKAHVRYLESRLVTLAQAAKRSRVENANAPAAPALSEYDRAEADAFLEDMLLVYPLLGIDAFIQPTIDAPSLADLHLKARGVEARGRDTASGFVVLKGSHAAKSETASLSSWVSTQRQNLIANGAFDGDGQSWILTQDLAFTSPSTAADVVLGRSSNGRTAWKDAKGRTLKEIQEAAGG